MKDPELTPTQATAVLITISASIAGVVIAFLWFLTTPVGNFFAMGLVAITVLAWLNAVFAGIARRRDSARMAKTLSASVENLRKAMAEAERKHPRGPK